MQYQKGYVAASTLIFVLATITLLGFCVETGRMIEMSSRLANGTGNSARGGAIMYGKTVTKEYSRLYELLKPTIFPEVENDLGDEATEKEIKDEVNRRIKESMKKKITQIKNKAETECKSKSQVILDTYQLNKEVISCNDEKVTVKSNIQYSPVISGIGIGGSIFREESNEKVYINKE